MEWEWRMGINRMTLHRDPPCSENANDAYPDRFNELWYVQTPARELNITSFVSSASTHYYEFTNLPELRILAVY